MKNTLSFLTKLRAKQIALSLDDSKENLRVRGALKNLTEADKQHIIENKPELIAFLKDKLSGSESISPVEKQANYPISEAQRRQWRPHRRR